MYQGVGVGVATLDVRVVDTYFLLLSCESLPTLSMRIGFANTIVAVGCESRRLSLKTLRQQLV